MFKKLKAVVLCAVGAVTGALVSASAMAQTATGAAAFEPVFEQAKSDFAVLMAYAVGACVVIWAGYMVFRIGRKLYNKVG